MKLFKTAILALTVHAMHITSPEATDNNDTSWMNHSHPSSSNLTSGVLPPGMPSKEESMKQLQAMFERKVVPVDPQQHLNSTSTEELLNATEKLLNATGGFYSNNTPPQSQAMPHTLVLNPTQNNTPWIRRSQAMPHTLVLNPTQNNTSWIRRSNPSSSNLTSGVLPPGMPSKEELIKQFQTMFGPKVVPVDPQQHLNSISTEELQNATRGFYSNNTPPQSQAMPQPKIELVHNNMQTHTLVLNPTQSEPELSHETSSTLVSTSDRGTPNPTQKKNKHPRKRPRE